MISQEQTIKIIWSTFPTDGPRLPEELFKCWFLGAVQASESPKELRVGGSRMGGCHSLDSFSLHHTLRNYSKGNSRPELFNSSEKTYRPGYF